MRIVARMFHAKLGQRAVWLVNTMASHRRILRARVVVMEEKSLVHVFDIFP